MSHYPRGSVLCALATSRHSLRYCLNKVFLDQSLASAYHYTQGLAGFRPHCLEKLYSASLTHPLASEGGDHSFPELLP